MNSTMTENKRDTSKAIMSNSADMSEISFT